MGLGKPLVGGKQATPLGPRVHFQRAGSHSSAHGQIQLDNLLRDGFLCAITTKIHQTELRGFNAGNCGAKCSIIVLSNESGENTVENEATLPLNSSRVMAQLVSPHTMP